jgi:hypothetical protein
VRAILPARRDRAHLVTEAQRPLSEDIAYRQRRYLIMMGIRIVCFGLALVLFVTGAGWLTAFPAVGAIVIPYFAVIFANGGREPTSNRGFRAYEPRLPARRSPPERGPAREDPGRPDGMSSAPPSPGSFTHSKQEPKGGQETADRQ